MKQISKITTCIITHIILLIISPSTVETRYKEIWYNKMPDITSYYSGPIEINLPLYCLLTTDITKCLI